MKHPDTHIVKNKWKTTSSRSGCPVKNETGTKTIQERCRREE